MSEVKRIIVILYILSAFCFAEWSGDASQPSSSRDVGGKIYWSITSPEELAWFKAQIEAGNDSINAVLENDIFMGKDSASVGSTVWTAIGAPDSIVFKGVFDGNHHVIYGLKSEGSVSNHGMFGLFGIVGGIVGYNAGGKIMECVNVGNIHVDTKTEMSTRNAEARVGGIAGFNYQGSVSKWHPLIRLQQ